MIEDFTDRIGNRFAAYMVGLPQSAFTATPHTVNLITPFPLSQVDVKTRDTATLEAGIGRSCRSGHSLLPGGFSWSELFHVVDQVVLKSAPRKMLP